MAVQYVTLEEKPHHCCGRNPLMRREYSAVKKEKRLYCGNCGRLGKKATSLARAVKKWNEELEADGFHV